MAQTSATPPEPRDPSFSAQLKADLLAGKFRPGEWLKQADLESMYGANRFEVRIALTELAARNLIDHFPNRGYRVGNPTDREREELYEVRTILETQAARLLVARVTVDDVDALTGLIQEFEAIIESGGLARLREVNFRFHDRFYEITGNRVLTAQIRELRERGTPGRSGSWETLAAIRASHADHVEMVELLRKRDVEHLAFVVHRHLNRWREFAHPSLD